MAALRELLASASRIITSKNGRSAAVSGNATLAWDMYDTVPEVGTFADWVSNAMSGATLFAGVRGPDGTIGPVPETHRAAELVASIAGGPDGQSVILGEVGTQLCVAGDFWQVIIPSDSDETADDRWLVLSTEEVTRQRGRLRIKVDGEDVDIPEFDPNAAPDPNAPAYFRVWKASPRNHAAATSPVIRSLAILQELRLLNAAVAAIARSRITGRGVLLVPAGTRLPVQPGQNGAQDSLLETFIEVASTAIREPESAAATVPIVLEIPGDLINGVKWLQFSSEFDSMALQLRDEAIRRFATGADIPAEILMGLGDASHWGAWAITAEALRMGAEPRLAMYCAALTEMWLQPILEAEGAPDASDVMVWYDTSGLRSSSNKGASALEAFKLGLIGSSAARRELGFTDADAPGVQDVAVNAIERNTLPVDETQAPPAEPALAATAVLDSFTAGTSAALAEAVDGLVWAALTSAGWKMTQTQMVARPFRAAARSLVSKGRVHVEHPVPTREAVNGYNLLEGAWVRADSVAVRYGLNGTDLAWALHEYVTALLVSGQPHDFDNIPRLLAQMAVQDVAA